jgi:hypothetical protein
MSKQTFTEYWNSLPEGKLVTPLKARIEMWSMKGMKVVPMWVPCEVVSKFKTGGKVVAFSNDEEIPETYRGKNMPIHHTHKIEVFF